MNSVKAQEDLAKADKHIKAGEGRIRKQEERINKLVADGHNTEASKETLERFKNLVKTMVKHRDLTEIFLRAGVK